MAGPRTKLLLRIATSLIVLTAPGVAAADATQPVTVVASEYKFSPKNLKFKRGVGYHLHIENRGKEMHEFTAPEFFKAVEVRNPAVLNADKTEIEIPPGTAKDLDFVPQRAGLYRLRCSDHDWAGMIGKITIE